MNDNKLFEKHQKENFSKKKAAPFAFSFVFLSLVLTILSFFIYLVHTSSFEKVKLDALKSSLHSSFPHHLPLFQELKPSKESAQIEIYYQHKILKMFPNSEIIQDLKNDEVTILIPTTNVFEATKPAFVPFANIFFDQMKVLLNSTLIKDKYTIDFILSEDLTPSQNYPIFSNLTTERLEKIYEKLQSLSLSPNIYGVGIEKGDSQKLKVHFYKGRNYQ